MKAIITDLDWTLLRSDKTVSEYTYTVLKKCHDQGIILMAATARPERAILTYQDKINFKAITTLNGARIILPHKIIENGILPSSAENILKKVIMIPDIVLSLETGNGIFSNVPIPEWNATVFNEFPALPTESIIYKILLSSKDDNIQQEVEKALTADTYMTVAEGKLIQIMSTASTKWNGIKAMLKAAGLKQDETVYFGDDNDDIEAIKNCGIGVAVSNAIDAVLDVADFITESNDLDGVARYIEENLLKKKTIGGRKMSNTQKLNEQDYILLFNCIHPNFFESENIRGLPEEEVYEEMFLPLNEFDPNIYDKNLDENFSFGFYDGNIEELKKEIEKVDQHWVQLYNENLRIYCGYIDGKVASFCIVEDNGLHNINGCELKIGGPGCVGTLPEYRHKGIGLTMIKHVTQILKEEGYDYSYIHYTGVASWYEKLGYKTTIKWNKNGVK